MAYILTSDSEADLARVPAHEVRALAASWPLWTNRSVADIMRACSWRSKTTFAEFYLRDMTFVSDDLYSLGPIVTAQGIRSSHARSGR